jgi:predicted RNase H-like HicB family nuclease
MHDDHYTYRVSWSPEDGEFVATVVEFRTLSWLAPDPAAALLALRALVSAKVAS